MAQSVASLGLPGLTLSDIAGEVAAVLLVQGLVDALAEEVPVAAAECIKIPDFRLVLSDGSQVLVEVKNLRQGRRNPVKPYSISIEYLEGLKRYSEMVKSDLKLAIYWSWWNVWTLVTLGSMSRRNGKAGISFPEALKANEMIALGDVMVGTRFPLELRLVADEGKPREITESGEVSFAVGKVQMLCADRPIRSRTETRIASWLLLFGKWRSEGPTVEAEDGKLKYVRHLSMPEEDHGQGFEIVGALSEMFSAFYREATSQDGAISRLELDVAPGMLGRLIPRDYKSDSLPLWIFHQMPNYS